MSPSHCPHPSRRYPPFVRQRGAAAFLAVALLVVVPLVGAPAEAARSGSAKAASASAARRSAQIEAANIAELRGRMTSKDLSLMRRAEIGDAAIEVWLYQPLRQYYVSVSLQGALRRTLKPVNESEAWLNFDSFRRLAALGEVGRPVLLGQMGAGSASAPALAPPQAVAPAIVPGQDLKTVTVSPERLGAPQDVDAMDLDLVQQARENYARAHGMPPPSSPSSAEHRTTGQSVETLQRQLIGEEMARLVWNAESGQYAASLTRQGRVVGMLRSTNREEALRGYDDLVRQAQARAAAIAGTAPASVPGR
ncbi:hypothetical protein SAMN05216359_101753 [Roseateles sp. YR242]|uniref:hypothetical protein n=1 Tax=Roseateles sp. YR242 TaxID=1855305 RepID=UPI0008CFCA40|nr:hypothetical protein [Roseateles sp. YR242]SEK41626.1 hypothetical protein SAMN05216359_101753 [Roseateles sp. YR242]